MPRDELPPPAMEVTLRPGDVLYLPRGTPHEAVADELAAALARAGVAPSAPR